MRAVSSSRLPTLLVSPDHQHPALVKMQNGVAMLRHYLRQSLLLAIFALTAMTVAPAVAQSPQGWVQAGVLSCSLNPSVGFVIFGHQSMECRFQPASGPAQGYEGAINTVGLDLGVSNGGRGRCSVRQRGFPTAHWQGNMSGRPAISASALAQARTCLSAARIAASLCNRFRWKGRLRLTSWPACHS